MMTPLLCTAWQAFSGCVRACVCAVGRGEAGRAHTQAPHPSHPARRFCLVGALPACPACVPGECLRPAGARREASQPGEGAEGAAQAMRPLPVCRTHPFFHVHSMSSSSLSFTYPFFASVGFGPSPLVLPFYTLPAARQQPRRLPNE